MVLSIWFQSNFLPHDQIDIFTRSPSLLFRTLNAHAEKRGQIQAEEGKGKEQSVKSGVLEGRQRDNRAVQ